MSKLLKILTLSLCIYIPAVYSMDTDQEDNQVLASGNFAQLPNDVIRYIIDLIYNNQDEKFIFENILENYSPFCNHIKDVVKFNKTCKYLNKLTEPFIITKVTGATSHTRMDTELVHINDLFIRSLQTKDYDDTFTKNWHKIAKLCVKMNVDVNQKIQPRSRIITPLLYAIQNGCPVETIKFLIDHGAQVNDETLSTAIYDSGIKEINTREIIKLLIKCGANVNAKNQDGQMPLHLAAMASKYHLIDLLIKHTSDINTEDNYGLTPLSYALSSYIPEKKNSSETIAWILIENGADIQKGIANLHSLMRTDKAMRSLLAKLENERNALLERREKIWNQHKEDPAATPPVNRHSNNNQFPHIPGNHADSDNNPNPDDGTFTHMLHNINANRLPIIVGVVAVGSLCYWIYSKYKTSQQSSENDEQKEENATAEQDETVEKQSEHKQEITHI